VGTSRALIAVMNRQGLGIFASWVLFALAALVATAASASCSQSSLAGSSCKAAGGTCVLGGATCSRQASSSAQDCNPPPVNPGGAFCCLELSEGGEIADATTGSAAGDAGADAGACTPVLASDYDQSCDADTDCVGVGEVPSCPALACYVGCTMWTINKSVLGQYMTTLSRASAAVAGESCSCPSYNPNPCCRGGMCTTTCLLPADTGADAPAPVPMYHRPDDSQCTTPRGAGNCTSTATGPAFTCSSDGQCADGGINGRCTASGGGPAGCTCTYDGCQTDSDCGAGQLCVCHGSAYSYGGNACMPGNCRVDSDCGAGGYCSPAHGTTNCGYVSGYYCHTARDFCTNDSDCSNGAFPDVCTWSATDNRWECQMALLCE
jgi:hypothetical protein